MMYQDYDQPNQRALLQQLQVEPRPVVGPTPGAPTKRDQLAPDAATAAANRAAMPDGPLKQMIGAMGPVSSMAAPLPASDYSRLSGGYNREKLNNADHQTAKYQMGRALAGFDPRQGLTPEVLAALNSLGFGNFSGSGQKLNLSGLTDKGKAAGLRGDYNNADFIEGFAGGNGKWQYADPFTEAQEAKGAPMGMGVGGIGSAMGGLASVLQGNPMAGIQAALGQYGEQSSNLQALLDQLAQGQQ